MALMLAKTEWMLRMREADAIDVAEALGLDVQRASGVSPGSFPCPRCGQQKRHGERRRGAIGVRADARGWKCHGCDLKGDVIDLVAWSREGDALPDLPANARLAVVLWCKQFLGMSDAEAGGEWRVKPTNVTQIRRPPPEYPDARWVASVWDSCLPVTDDADVAFYLSGRKIDPYLVKTHDMARALPRDSALCPEWGCHGHRLVVPMRDHDGVTRNLKARDVTGKASAKSISASGCLTRGLSFWDDRIPSASRVFIVEGEIKWLQIMEIAELTDAVLGTGSGLYTSDVIGRIHAAAQVFIWTDADTKEQAGARYANDIVRMLTPQQRKRARLWGKFEVVKNEQGRKVQVRADLLEAAAQQRQKRQEQAG